MRNEQLELFSKQKIESIQSLRGSELTNYFFNLVDNISSNNEIEITENNILDISDDNKKIEVLQSIYENLENVDDKKLFYEIIMSKENILGTQIIVMFKEYISDKEKQATDIEIPKVLESNKVESKQIEREISLTESFESEVLQSNNFESETVETEIPQVEMVQEEVMQSNNLETNVLKQETTTIETIQPEELEPNLLETKMIKPEMSKVEKGQSKVIKSNTNESVEVELEIPQIETVQPAEIELKQQQIENSIQDLKTKVQNLREDYKGMLLDGYIDNIELDNIILEINGINNHIVGLEILLQNPKEKNILLSVIPIIEKDINKLESIKNERIKTFKEKEQNDMNNFNEITEKGDDLSMQNNNQLVVNDELSEILHSVNEIKDIKIIIEKIKGIPEYSNIPNGVIAKYVKEIQKNSYFNDGSLDVSTFESKVSIAEQDLTEYISSDAKKIEVLFGFCNVKDNISRAVDMISQIEKYQTIPKEHLLNVANGIFENSRLSNGKTDFITFNNLVSKEINDLNEYINNLEQNNFKTL